MKAIKFVYDKKYYGIALDKICFWWYEQEAGEKQEMIIIKFTGGLSSNYYGEVARKLNKALNDSFTLAYLPEDKG